MLPAWIDVCVWLKSTTTRSLPPSVERVGYIILLVAWIAIALLEVWIIFNYLCCALVGRFDRARVTNGMGHEYEIFNPPPWRLDRWVWWWTRRPNVRDKIQLTFMGEPTRTYRVFEVRS